MVHKTLVNMKYVAEYLSVCEVTIYRLIRKKKIPYLRAGNQYRFSMKMIDDWLEKNTSTEEGKRIVGKVLTATLVAAYVSCGVGEALMVKPIKERQRHYRTMLKDMGATPGQAARMTAGYHNAFPFHFDNTLRDTELYQKLVHINHGEDLREIYIDGFYDSAHKYYKDETARLDPNELLLVYWDMHDTVTGKRFFGFAVDRNIHFRRSIASRRKLLPMFANDPVLLVAFREDIDNTTIAFDNVGLGKLEQFERQLDRNQLQRQGLMRDVFANLETFIRTHYPGWTLFMIPNHPQTRKFAVRFDPMPEENRYFIEAARMSVEEFRTVAEVIKAYIQNRLRKEGPFPLHEVYRAYHEVNVRLVDRIIYTQFETSQEKIVSPKTNAARLSDVVDQWYRSIKRTAVMA